MTYILLMNKELYIKVGKLNKSINQRYVTIVYVISTLTNNNPGIWFNILTSDALSK